MLFDTKFDLVVSVGEDCACSGYLRRCKLQDFSYPLDWLTKASFITRLMLILNNFSNFLNKEDLYPLEKPKTGIVDEKCDYWADKKYDFYFYHDFKSGESFDAEYLRVKNRFNRRIERLYEQISVSNNVLFVWWSRDKHQELDSVKEYYLKLAQKFSSQSVYLLIIEYSENEEELFLENNHILISRFDNISYKHNRDWNETMGNENNNLKIFSQIKMRRSLEWRVKFIFYSLLKIMIGILPRKSIRDDLRGKLKIKFYKETL